MEGVLIESAADDNNTASSSNFIQQLDSLHTDATDQAKKTAVIIAIENNNINAVRLLVENGCRLANSTNVNDVRLLDIDTYISYRYVPL